MKSLIAMWGKLDNETFTNSFLEVPPTCEVFLNCQHMKFPRETWVKLFTTEGTPTDIANEWQSTFGNSDKQYTQQGRI